MLTRRNLCTRRPSLSAETLTSIPTRQQHNALPNSKEAPEHHLCKRCYSNRHAIHIDIIHAPIIRIRRFGWSPPGRPLMEGIPSWTSINGSMASRNKTTRQCLLSELHYVCCSPKCCIIHNSTHDCALEQHAFPHTASMRIPGLSMQRSCCALGECFVLQNNSCTRYIENSSIFANRWTPRWACNGKNALAKSCEPKPKSVKWV